MTDNKDELVSRFAGMYEFLHNLENLRAEAGERHSGVKAAQSVLDNRQGSVTACIWTVIICLLGAGAILYFTDNLPRALALQKLEFSGILGLVLAAAGAILLLVAAVSLIRLPISMVRIPGSKRDLAYAQELYDDANARIDDLAATMPNELADANMLFPGSTYPPSRHVKYGIDMLNSGRADTLKEVMTLIDELAHRETMEYEARQQTQNTAAAARAARSAESAARSAASSASSAAYNASQRR